jgi:hypothetical protein
MDHFILIGGLTTELSAWGGKDAKHRAHHSFRHQGSWARFALPILRADLDAERIFPVKYLSVSVLFLQILALVFATIFLFRQLGYVVAAGAWFSDMGRLVAALAPYLILPFSIILSFLLHRTGCYGPAAFLPIVLLAIAVAAGQIYLTIVPDPILDNFGPRPVPYPGFLVLPSEEVPSGFQEVSHHYTKQEYDIKLKQTRNGDQIDLEIFESPITQFLYSPSEIVREFDYQGITGHVYVHASKRGQEKTLVWLNPPRQRISISLAQRVGDDYSPDDLIRVLKSMKPATVAP